MNEPRSRSKNELVKIEFLPAGEAREAIILPSVQISLAPWPIGSFWEREGRFSRDPLPVFFAGGPCGQIWHGQGCPLLDVVHPAFPLPTTASPTLQGALKEGFGEAVVAGDMPQ